MDGLGGLLGWLMCPWQGGTCGDAWCPRKPCSDGALRGRVVCTAPTTHYPMQIYPTIEKGA